jgi:hypothetical protein
MPKSRAPGFTCATPCHADTRPCVCACALEAAAQTASVAPWQTQWMFKLSVMFAMFVSLADQPAGVYRRLQVPAVAAWLTGDRCAPADATIMLMSRELQTHSVMLR